MLSIAGVVFAAGARTWFPQPLAAEWLPAYLPWFLAGALFPIIALPHFLTWAAKLLPLTHALALMRFGLNGDSTGLHAIWSMNDPTAMAGLSLAVVAAFAALLTTASIRVFSRSAVR